ncbi:MAG: 50S ribosomal protein L32e [Methanomicrobiales archaeon]|nr:50S ribosomal protein L32e [Methanomicrobiales archaeon]
MADEKMRLIRIRNGNRARFQRRGIHEKKRLAAVWRKPKGRHNKLRRQIKAKGPLPRPGYGSPAAVRGLHPSGLSDILVANEAMLAGLDPEVHAVRIAAGVGMKKKMEIQKKAMDAGLRVLNPRPVPVPEEEPSEEPAEESPREPADEPEGEAENHE